MQPSTRYAHSAAYLQKLATEYGFVLEKIERRVIRQDAGADINGYLVLMTCIK